MLLSAGGADPVDIKPQAGAWLWMELWTRDLSEAAEFYKALVAYQVAEKLEQLKVRYGIKKEFILFVGVLEPRKNIERLIRVFNLLVKEHDFDLVIAGKEGWGYQSILDLPRQLGLEERVIFTGYVFGRGYREFQSNAYAYIQATEVGGTHPALLEGMGHGNCVLANDVPEHREVLGDAGYFFSTQNNGELTEKIQDLIDHPEKVEAAREKAVQRIRKKYTWDRVSEAYERLFRRLVER